MKSFACLVLLAGAVLAEPPFRQRLNRFQRQELAKTENLEPSPEVGPYEPAGFRPAIAFNLPVRQISAQPSTTYGIPNESNNSPTITYSSPAKSAPQTEYGVPENVEPRIPADALYTLPADKPAIDFRFPVRQEFAPPSTAYGIPDDSYSAPILTYSVPQEVNGVPQTEYGVPETKEEIQKNTETTEQAEVKEAKEVKKSKSEEKENIAEEPKKDAEVVNNQGVYYILLPDAQLQRVQFQTENDIRNMAYTARVQYKQEERAPVYVYTTVPQYQNAAYVRLY